MDAYASIWKDLGSMRAKIYTAIKRNYSNGLTDEEIETKLDMKHQTVSARRGELETKELIYTNGLTRPTKSGRQAYVWFPA